MVYKLLLSKATPRSLALGSVSTLNSVPLSEVGYQSSLFPKFINPRVEYSQVKSSPSLAFPTWAFPSCILRLSTTKVEHAQTKVFPIKLNDLKLGYFMGCLSDFRVSSICHTDGLTDPPKIDFEDGELGGWSIQEIIPLYQKIGWGFQIGRVWQNFAKEQNESIQV